MTGPCYFETFCVWLSYQNLSAKIWRRGLGVFDSFKNEATNLFLLHYLFCLSIQYVLAMRWASNPLTSVWFLCYIVPSISSRSFKKFEFIYLVKITILKMRYYLCHLNISSNFSVYSSTWWFEINQFWIHYYSKLLHTLILCLHLSPQLRPTDAIISNCIIASVRWFVGHNVVVVSGIAYEITNPNCVK